MGIAAQATAAQSMTASEYVQQYSGPLLGYETNLGLGTVNYAGASATASGGPNGAAVTAVAHGDNTADAAETYYEQITGPAGVVAPFDLRYNLSVSGASGNASASVSLSTDQNASNITVKRFGFNNIVLPVINNTMSLSSVLEDWGTAGTEAEIQISADADHNGIAFVDPLFELNPTWAAANPLLASQISWSTSPGIVNGFGVPALPAGVPEPATWATMLLGLFGVGAVMRSRRKVAGTAAAA